MSTKESKVFRPDIVVLGPGGVKGLLQLGALFVLARRGFLDEVKNYTGVSIGAIIALLLCLGYEIPEIIEQALNTDLFRSINTFSFSDMKIGTGFTSNEAIKAKLVQLVTAKLGIVPSMEQLHQSTGMEYCVVAYNSTKKETEYISRTNNANISVIEATLLSTNIPILFYKAIYNGNVYIDGALGNPYPVDYYDKKGAYILGIYVDNDDKSESTEAYVNSIIMAPMRELRKRIIESSSSYCKHLGIYTNIINTTGLSLSIQDKASMVIAGYKEAQRFIAQLCTESNESEKNKSQSK